MERLLRFKLGKTLDEIHRLLRHRVRAAYRDIAAYRRLLDESRISPAVVRSVTDLSLLPVLQKERLFLSTDRREALHARALPDRLTRVSTGGSTSLPLNVYMNRFEASYRRLLLLNSWRRVARLPAVLRIADLGSWVKAESGTEIARRGVNSILRISIGLPVEQQAALLRDYRPHVVSGYPTATGMVAGEILASPLREPPLLVALRGEVLHEPVRRTIEEAFACRAADFYNCEEVGNIAWECPNDPSVLHVNTDACIVEVIDS
jgi:phenylacetate-CoA ligase